jgi:glutamyl-Q tRNA(Asp) synthetase
LLQALLDLPVPAYGHHRLILDETGKRFAKRDRGAALRNLHESGKTPKQIRTMLGFS